MDSTVTSLLIKEKTGSPDREYKQKHQSIGACHPGTQFSVGSRLRWALYAMLRLGFYLVGGRELEENYKQGNTLLDVL